MSILDRRCVSISRYIESGPFFKNCNEAITVNMPVYYIRLLSLNWEYLGFVTYNCSNLLSLYKLFNCNDILTLILFLKLYIMK